MTNPLTVFAMALLASLPILAIAVVGVVVSRMKLRQSHAKAKRLATAGFSLMALQAVVGASIPAYVGMSVAGTGDRLAMANVVTFSGMAAHLLLLASMILLLLAVLADRKTPESSSGAI